MKEGQLYDVTFEGGKLMIEANSEVFIVPNPPITALQYFDPGREVLNMKHISDLNGVEYNPDQDLLIQLWWTAEESLGSQNLEDHGCIIDTADGNVVFRPGTIKCGRLPINVCKKIKEGESIAISVPAVVWTTSIDEKVKRHLGIDDSWNGEAVFKFHTTGAQSKYRYRHYGTFENCLDKAVESAK